ncbi:hypothetical protein MPL3356_340206 [Mesorhizobium plurifarium]|uniref:Uncharacterized protein n=1 Tax=Mesorhizobium plurifarium TaxID=69974 RepID=A0A090FQC5_MESPL|nr:hypothetical protein MPL3356_340206 [Mesorhizobium plurifarium]
MAADAPFMTHQMNSLASHVPLGIVLTAG